MAADYGALMDGENPGSPALIPTDTAQIGQDSLVTQPAPPSKYGSLMDDETGGSQADLQRSFVAASDKDPDRQAKVVKLADEMKMPPSVVEQFYDDVMKKREQQAVNYAGIERDTPALGGFLKDPNNAALAKDDLPALERTEKSVKDYGLLQSMYLSLGSGLNSLYGSAARLPGLAVDLANLPYNLAVKTAGRPDLQMSAPDWLTNNPATKYFEGNAKAVDLPELHESVTHEIGQGNFARAGRVLAIQLAANAPQQAAIIAGTLAGFGVPTLAAAGAVSATDSLRQGREAGADPASATSNALFHGVAEAAFEKLGTFGILKKWEGAIANQFGKQVSREVFKDFGKTIAYSVAGEGNEEFWTSVAGDFSDYITGVNPDGLTGIGQRALDAGILGGASGGTMTAPSAIASGVVRGRQVREAQLAKDFYLAAGTDAESSKLRERLPDKHRELLETMTQGTPVQDVYVDARAIDTFFQSQNLNPVAGMQALGLSQQYEEAKTMGGDVKVPLATWVERAVGTPLYQGIADDVRFGPDGVSLNEAKAISQKAEETAVSSDADTFRAGSELTDQLKATGLYTSDQVEAYSAELDSRYRSLGERMGMTADEAFKLVNPGGVQIQAANPRTGDALEQGSRGDWKKEGYKLSVSGPVDFTGADDGQMEASLANRPERRPIDFSMVGSDGNEVGSLRAGLTDDGKNIYVWDVNVDEEHQRKGIATALYQKAEKKFKKAFVPGITGLSDGSRALWNQPGRPFGKLFQSGEDTGPRGSITLGDRAIIRLGEAKDLSTFLHESGHLFLDETGKVDAHLRGLDPATLTDSQKQLLADGETILKFLGVSSFADIKTEQHEQWARGWEAFHMQGKAPSQALRQAFVRFRTWLTAIYKRLSSLNVTLTPEIQDVMKRMVATDSEIAAAENTMNSEPLFTGDPATFGMNGAKGEAYWKAVADEREASREALNQRLLNDVRKKQSGEYKTRREEVRTQVEKDVNAQPVYVAISAMQKGTKPDGTPLPDGTIPVKLSRAAVEQLAPVQLSRLPRGTTTRDGGLHPDVAADAFGFRNGTELIQQMALAENREDRIESLTDQRMKEEFPELYDSPTLSEEAINALHNEKRALRLRMELEGLATNAMPVLKDVIRQVSRRPPSSKLVREQAQRVIGNRQVLDISPAQFRRAESRAAREAGEALAKGDFEAAYAAKERELYNFELYRAAIEAQETVEKSLELFKKIARADEKIAKSRDTDYVNTARAVLAQFGIGKTEKTAAEYLAPLKAYSPDVYETMQALVDSATKNPGPYTQVSFNDFVAMKDAVEALWDLARTSKQIEIDGKMRDRDEVKGELEERLSELKKPEGKKAYYGSASTWEKTKMGFLGIRAALRRVESWVGAVDGDSSSAFRRYIWNPISEATSRYRIAKNVYLQRYLDLLKPIETTLTGDPIVAPELGEGAAFKDKASLIGALLHTGNESNLSKLLRGYNWGTVNEDGVLDSGRWGSFLSRMHAQGIITKADWDFVQSVWDLTEELKPDAQKAHKAMYGYYFNEITAAQVVTPFGVYRGGYVPAIADPMLARDQSIRNEREALEKSNNSFMFPTAGRGFTKSRVDAYAAPLALDLRYVPMHLDKVLRFIHIEPHVKSVGRVVMDRSFRKQLDAFDPTVGGDMLVPWLQRAAQQKVTTATPTEAGRWIDNFSRTLRTRTGLQIMTVNVVNAMQQATGLSIAAIKVKPKHLRNALWSYTRAPIQTAEAISEKSEFMRTRISTQTFDIQQQIEDLILNPSKYEKAIQFATKHGYVLTAGFQNAVDTITWAGGYDQAIENGASEVDAVREADSAVRETQGSFNAEDVSRFETGTPFMRAFTMFYSYFNMQANLLGTEFVKVARDMGLKKGAGRGLYLYAFGFMLPAVLGELIVKAMSGKLDDDDDDQYLDDVMQTFFQGQVRSATAMFPVVGQAVQAGINYLNDKWYDDRITVSPAISMIESAAHAPGSVYKAIFEDGSKKRAVRDVFSAIGLFAGIPLVPLSRPVGYLLDVQEGNAQPTGPIDFTRGLVTGRSGQ